MFAWLATDARTGVILDDLPDLDVPSVSTALNLYQSTTANLPVPTAPKGWLRDTLHGGSNLILTDDGVPLWGGMVTVRNRTEADVVPLSLATLEAYFDRRYVGDVVYTQVGQNTIVTDLIKRFVADPAVGGTSGKPGIPIRVQVTTAGVGMLRDRTYADTDDKTVYSVLTELAGVIGGPEWTIGWEWLHNPERITPVLYVGDRVGSAPSAGLLPSAVFQIPGPASSVSVVEDYSSGKGATDVMAVSTAQGTVRPQSPHESSSDTIRPTFEWRYTPSTSITDVTTLTGHAQAALGLLADGALSVSISAVWDKAPLLGTDWRIGDDVGFVVGGIVPDPTKVLSHDVFIDLFTDRFGVDGMVLKNPDGTDTVPSFPKGYSGSARCVGWSIAPLTGTPIVSPVLATPTDLRAA